MKNLIVVLYIDNKVCQWRIDDLIQHSFNGYIDKNYVFGKENVYFSVQIKDEVYCLQASNVYDSVYSAAWYDQRNQKRNQEIAPLPSPR